MILVSDFDDTLVDTRELKADAFRRLFHRYPQHLVAVDRLHRANSGLTRFEKFRRIHDEILHIPLDSAEEARLDAELRTLVLDGITSAPIAPGVEALLGRLGPTVPFYVLSNTPEAELREMLRRLRLDRFVTGAFGFPRRKPEMLASFAAKHMLPLRRIVFVGDSVQDQTSATAADVTFVARLAPDLPPLSPPPRWRVADFAELEAHWDDLVRATA